MKSLNIKTLDGGDFKVDWELIQKSPTLKTMVEDLGINQDSVGEDTIPLSNEKVTSEVFEKVLKWLEHFRGYPEPTEIYDNEDDPLKPRVPANVHHLNSWEQKYINIPVPKMFPLFICAKFLEIKGLSRLMAMALALQMQGKTVEEIRKNWTDKELQKLREDYPWGPSINDIHF